MFPGEKKTKKHQGLLVCWEKIELPGRTAILFTLTARGKLIP